MMPASVYKTTRLADAKREALTWLAGQLRWERTLDQLRSHPTEAQDRQAA